MQLRWTEEAADLDRIAEYLFEHTPERAARLVRALYEAPATLLTFPNRGTPGKKEGTRELVSRRYPRSLSTRYAAMPSTSSGFCRRAAVAVMARRLSWCNQVQGATATLAFSATLAL
jgi:plasmid stabilization system protein ParE